MIVNNMNGVASTTELMKQNLIAETRPIPKTAKNLTTNQAFKNSNKRKSDNAHKNPIAMSNLPIIFTPLTIC